jgi:hypothetical protein
MTRDQIQAALARGGPFTLLMADGKEYHVPHEDYIWLPPRSSSVFVWDDTGHFTVLPLLTMTGLHQFEKEGGATDQETPSGPS